MAFRREFRALTALGLAACVACPPAQALVTLNDGRDRVYVTGTVGVAYDSNVFAANGGEGDTIYTANISADYSRRAGWIGVNASVGMSLGNFTKLSAQNFSDPSFNVEFTKQSGRTTGAVTISAARESRADPAINTRSSTWNFSYGANFRYHIAGTYDLSGNFGYSQRKYAQDEIYANLDTFSAAFDLFHVFTTERDLIAGYRYRYSETSHNTSSDDHGFNVGLHGKILRGLNGTVRFGYQFRKPHGTLVTDSTYSSWTASGTASYAISKKINLSGTLAKDFSTTSTDSSVDSLNASLDVQYAFNSRWAITGSVGWSDSRFLGQSGRIVIDAGPPVVLGPNRHDNALNASATTSYTLNEHLKLSLTYLWFKNWSNISFADFVRQSWTANLSSRW